MKSDNLADMMSAVLKVSADRDWDRIHTPKNLAANLVREASELLENCLWVSDEEIMASPKRIAAIKQEMRDVLHCLLLIANSIDADLPTCFWKKLAEVKKRYPPVSR